MSGTHSSLPLIQVDELPSQFKAYPEGSTITYRPYTFGEIKKVAQTKATPVELFKLIMEGIQTSFDVRDLTLADFLFIALLRKLSSLGSTNFRLETSCPKCGSRIKKVFASDSFEFADLDVPELPIEADLADKTLIFSPITIGQFMELIESGKSGDEIALIAVQVKNYPFLEAYDVINNLTGEDVELINEIDEVMYHDLKPMEAECGSCKHISYHDLQSKEDLIRPFRGSDEPVRNRIRFGVSA